MVGLEMPKRLGFYWAKVNFEGGIKVIRGKVIHGKLSMMDNLYLEINSLQKT
jgi:hypothetical protein